MINYFFISGDSKQNKKNPQQKVLFVHPRKRGVSDFVARTTQNYQFFDVAHNIDDRVRTDIWHMDGRTDKLIFETSSFSQPLSIDQASFISPPWLSECKYLFLSDINTLY